MPYASAGMRGAGQGRSVAVMHFRGSFCVTNGAMCQSHNRTELWTSFEQEEIALELLSRVY